MREIDQWWPQLHEEVRRALVNGIWMPVSAFARAEVERMGGPRSDDDYWQSRNGDYYLPHSAVRWITESSDFERFLEPVKSDARAAYFRRGWPRR